MSAVPFNRRGACPALTAPMQTGDGLLARLNPVNEGLTPIQLIGLCESALRHGNGIVEITARGSFQIRGLSQQSAPLLAEDVTALGIETRTGIPIDISPLAGLDPTEIIDPRPLADQLRERIGSLGLPARLGPKVSVVIEAGGHIDLNSVSADIRLTAARRRNGAFWRIAIAGDAHAAEPMGGASASGALDFTIDLLEQIADRGSEARARDLLDATAGVIPHDADIPSPTALRAIALSDGRVALPIALPFGTTDAQSLRAFAGEAEQNGAAEFRLAPSRRLLAICNNISSALAVHSAANRLGFITQSEDPRLAIAACTGAPACASGRIATRDIANQLASQQPEILEHYGMMHVSGCAKGCAHPAAAPLTLVGTENGIELVVNGKASDAAGTVVPSANLSEALDTLRRTHP